MDRGVRIGLVNHQGRFNGAALWRHVHLLHSEQPPWKTHQVDPTAIRGIPRPVRTMLHWINPGESPALVLHLFKASLFSLIKKKRFLSFFSKSHLNGCTPDYSKVKPRVNFPKVSYKPPKSRLRYKGETLSSRPPIGAESIEEDSRDMPGAPRATPDTAGGCQVLRSPREATRLLSELEVRFQCKSKSSALLPSPVLCLCFSLPSFFFDFIRLSASTVVGELQQAVD